MSDAFDLLEQRRHQEGRPFVPPIEYEPIGTSAEYEHFVEQPRRDGRDPVWESLMAEALAPVHRRRA